MLFCGTLCKPCRLALSGDAESLAGGGGLGEGGRGEGGGWLPFRKMQSYKQEEEQDAARDKR